MEEITNIGEERKEQIEPSHEQRQHNNANINRVQQYNKGHVNT